MKCSAWYLTQAYLSADTDIHEVELGGSDSGKNEQERQIQDACKADIT